MTPPRPFDPEGLARAERYAKSLFDTTFDCPCCGKTYDGAESETAVDVVTYWGDDPHDFSCGECGADFTVRETVMRTFEVEDAETPE